MTNKDKNVLVYSTRAVNSKHMQSLFEEMMILKEFADNIHYMGFTKTSKSYERVKNLSEIDDLIQTPHTYLKWYTEEVASRKLTDWDDIIDKIDIRPFRGFDRIYVWGGLINSVCARRPKQIKTIKTFPYLCSKVWTSLGIQYINILAILKAHREYGIPITEIMHDPGEASLNLIETERLKINPEKYELKFNYAIPKYGVEKLDMMQYYLKNRKYDASNITRLFFESPKKYEFTFGYTVVMEDRNVNDDELVKLIHSKFNNPNIFVKHKFKGINTFVNRTEYLNYIDNSDYTLIIPSYEKDQVSIIRIIEAAHHNCMPLFTEDNNWDALLESFPNFNYKNYIINKSWEKPKTQEEYVELLLHVKETFLSINDLSIGNQTYKK